MVADTALSQEVVGVQRTKRGGRRWQKFAAIFAAQNDALLRKAETGQVRQSVKASLAVKSCVAGDVCEARKFIPLFCNKSFFLCFLNGITILQGDRAKKDAAAKNNLPQVVSIAMETILDFGSTGYVSRCLQNCHSHAREHEKTRSRA